MRQRRGLQSRLLGTCLGSLLTAQPSYVTAASREDGGCCCFTNSSPNWLETQPLVSVGHARFRSSGLGGPCSGPWGQLAGGYQLEPFVSSPCGISFSSRFPQMWSHGRGEDPERESSVQGLLTSRLGTGPSHFYRSRSVSENKAYTNGLALPPSLNNSQIFSKHLALFQALSQVPGVHRGAGWTWSHIPVGETRHQQAIP